jgi:hypothetical protein
MRQGDPGRQYQAGVIRGIPTECSVAPVIGIRPHGLRTMPGC